MAGGGEVAGNGDDPGTEGGVPTGGQDAEGGPVRDSWCFWRSWNSRLAASDTDGLSGAGKNTCRIPGFDFAERENDRCRAHVGAVEDDIQTCSVDDETDVSAPGFAGRFVMARQPRLAASLTGSASDGTPGKGCRGKGKISGREGIPRAECGGEPTGFYLNLGDELRSIARPGTRQVFARAANSVAERIGCEAVAPRS